MIRYGKAVLGILEKREKFGYKIEGSDHSELWSRNAKQANKEALFKSSKRLDMNSSFQIIYMKNQILTYSELFKQELL